VIVTGQQRYCPVVWSKNKMLRPHWVVVAGKEEEHHEGSYYLEWRENARRVRLSVGNDAVLAVNRLRRQEAILRARENGLNVLEAPQRQSGILVATAVATYLDEVRQAKKKKTYVAYKKALEYFLESCRKQYLHQIERKDLLNFAAFLREQKQHSARTVNVKFGYLTIFLKAQKITRLAEKNDWPRYVETEPEIYEREELDKFFAACTADEKMYYQFFLKTGMREQEAMHVTWGNVNLKAGEVAVRSNERFGFMPKTYEERTIPIPDDLVADLRAWKQKSNQSCPLVFPTSGCKPKNDFLDVCKAIALRARVNCGHCAATLNGKPVKCANHPVCEHWFLHKFRATFCTWHLWSGNDLRTVQAYMGHKDLESTMRYLKPNRGEEARKKVNAAFQ
jgi:integrase/recombinase XerD